MAYDAVLFDNDGVLIEDTASEVMQAGVRNAFESVGITEPDPEHISSFTNFSAVTVERICEVGHLHGLDPESFWTTREREVCAVQQDVIRTGEKALFDDFDALDTLEQAGVDLGIVSNNQQDIVGFMIDHFGLDGRFETFYGVEPTLDGIRRKKPDPYYVLQAISDIGSTDVLFVGDRETDIHAARHAGADAVYLRRDTSYPPADSLEHQPDFVIESLVELPAIATGETPSTLHE